MKVHTAEKWARVNALDALARAISDTAALEAEEILLEEDELSGKEIRVHR